MVKASHHVLCPGLPSVSCGPTAACLCEAGTVTAWVILSGQCMGLGTIQGTLGAEGFASSFLCLDFWRLGYWHTEGPGELFTVAQEESTGLL